ncbi:MAG TPA: response regulator [Verrucomicrobiae bacterium]|jgi:CheY-like chemotaxis protein
MRPLRILLAEDDVDDAELIAVALQRSNLAHSLHHVSDGEMAISYLTGEAQYSQREQFPLPAVLLLDLKMPRKNGFEVLQWIRSTKEWAQLPVIVLTSSDEPSDIKRAYELGATSYLTKSASFKNVLEILTTLSPSWK